MLVKNIKIYISNWMASVASATVWPLFVYWQVVSPDESCDTYECRNGADQGMAIALFSIPLVFLFGILVSAAFIFSLRGKNKLNYKNIMLRGFYFTLPFSFVAYVGSQSLMLCLITTVVSSVASTIAWLTLRIFDQFNANLEGWQ